MSRQLCVYLPEAKQVSRLDSNKEALVDAVVTPLLSPVIYTLRNKQGHQAPRDTLSRGEVAEIDLWRLSGSS